MLLCDLCWSDYLKCHTPSWYVTPPLTPFFLENEWVYDKTEYTIKLFTKFEKFPPWEFLSPPPLFEIFVIFGHFWQF